MVVRAMGVAYMLGLSCALCAGCIPALPLRHLSLEADATGDRIAGVSAQNRNVSVDFRGRSHAEIARAEHRETLSPVESQAPAPASTTLADLLDIALRHHPDVRSAHARADAARGRMIQAGLYPNPVFGPNLDQMGDRVHKIAEPGLQINQTIVTAGKRRLAKAAAAQGVQAADWQAVTRWHDVVLRARLAYYELLTSLREQDTMAAIVRIAEEGHKTATTFENAGAGNRPDVLRAKVELEQNLLKKEVSRRRVEAAWQNLHTALGRPALELARLALDGKALDLSPPSFDWNALLDCVKESSSILQEARSLIGQQEKLLAKARADVRPNIDVQFNPYYAAEGREFRTQLVVTAPVPIFDRNQGNIYAAQADLARLTADEQTLELQLTERLTSAYQRYQAARKQAAAYRDTIVPDARASLELIEKGYRGGDKKYDFTAYLQAQQVLFQAQLAQTQALGDLWRATVEIAWLAQQDFLTPICGARGE